MDLARFEMSAEDDCCLWTRGKCKDLFSNLSEVVLHHAIVFRIFEQKSYSRMPNKISW